MEAWIVPTEMSDSELSEFAWERAVEHAEMYGIYNPGEESDWDDADLEDEDNGYFSQLNDWEQVEGWWEDYDPEKHDGHLLKGADAEVRWNKY